MNTRTVQITAHIQNSPDKVMNYIADVRNRPFFLPSLKAVADIQGDPSAVGTTWKWKWVALGMQFEGVGRCMSHERGRQYTFQTEGGIKSTWTYKAEPESGGTKVTCDLEYEIPERALARLSSKAVLDVLRKSEADHAVQNLKLILDR
jgi:carbon monoxide dehydrogenase subunit G